MPVPIGRAVALLLLASSLGCQGEDVVMPYLGGTVTLADERRYRQVCRNDSAVLRPDEALKIEKMLLGHPIPRGILSRNEVVEITSDLKVPSFGLSELGQALPDGSKLWMVDVEVPCRARERTVVFHGIGDRWTLIDDFSYSTADDDFVLTSVTLRDGRLRYSVGHDGRELLRKPLSR